MSKLTGTLRTIYRVITSQHRASAPVVPAASPAKSAGATPPFADIALLARDSPGPSAQLELRSIPNPNGYEPHGAASLWRAKSRGYRSTPHQGLVGRARWAAALAGGAGGAAFGVNHGGVDDGGGGVDMQSAWTEPSRDATTPPPGPPAEEAPLMEAMRVWLWAWRWLVGEAAPPRRARLSALGYAAWLAWVGVWSVSEALLLEYIYQLGVDVEEATCDSDACTDDGWDAASSVHLAGELAMQGGEGGRGCVGDRAGLSFTKAATGRDEGCPVEMIPAESLG